MTRPRSSLRRWSSTLRLGSLGEMLLWRTGSANPSLTGEMRIRTAGNIRSGCAVINTVARLCAIDATDAQHQQPAFGLLVAGEGSRLWGISANLAFVKGLTNVLGLSLIEQTVHQGILLLSEAPNRGKDLLMIAGTDNVVLPSQKLALVDGSPFARAGKSPIFFFSKEVQILNDKGDVIDQKRLKELAELGIMLVNDRSEPILFLEKVAAERILEVLRERKKRSVYFNAFYFAMTREAAKLLVKLYSQKASTGVKLYEMAGFDWSMHVLEALATSSTEAWAARNNRKLTQSDSDWQLFFSAAQEFKKTLGSPVVINLGEDAIFFDTGMAKDLVDLYAAAVSSGPLNSIIRQLFHLSPHEDVIGHHPHNNSSNISLPPRKHSYLLVDSLFRNGAKISEGCVVVNSVFENYVELPPHTIVVNSHVHALAPNAQSHSLVYGYNGGSATLQLLSGAVHFSAFVHTNEKTIQSMNGTFPVSVIPKQRGTDPLLNWYNVGDRAGKQYLAQQILGFDQPPVSFRDLQERKKVSLKDSLEFVYRLNAQTSK